MVEFGGIWAGNGIMLAVMLLLIVFAIYKQHFGKLDLPERVPEPTAPATEPTPAHVYEQSVVDSGEVAVKVGGAEGATDGAPCPEAAAPASPYAYENPIQLETST